MGVGYTGVDGVGAAAAGFGVLIGFFVGVLGNDGQNNGQLPACRGQEAAAVGVEHGGRAAVQADGVDRAQSNQIVGNLGEGAGGGAQQQTAVTHNGGKGPQGRAGVGLLGIAVVLGVIGAVGGDVLLALHQHAAAGDDGLHVVPHGLIGGAGAGVVVGEANGIAHGGQAVPLADIGHSAGIVDQNAASGGGGVGAAAVDGHHFVVLDGEDLGGGGDRIGQLQVIGHQHDAGGVVVQLVDAPDGGRALAADNGGGLDGHPVDGHFAVIGEADDVVGVAGVEHLAVPDQRAVNLGAVGGEDVAGAGVIGVEETAVDGGHAAGDHGGGCRVGVEAVGADDHVTGAAGHVHIDQLAAGSHAGTSGDAAGGMGRRNQRQRHGSGQGQGKQSFHDGCHFLLLIFPLISVPHAVSFGKTMQHA